MFSTKVSAMANESGVTYQSGRAEKKFNDILVGEKPGLVVVDLEDEVMQGRLETVMNKWPGIRVLGFCSHVREELIGAAEAKGVFVSTRGQFDRFLAAEVASLLSTAV
jgi:hypothetical protein